MTSRRSFLLGLGAALAAPAVVRADSLMKLWVPPLPIVWGDGIHDDAPGLNALLAGQRAIIKSEAVEVVNGAVFMRNGIYLIRSAIELTSNNMFLGSNSTIEADLDPGVPAFRYGRGANVAMLQMTINSRRGSSGISRSVISQFGASAPS